MARTPRVASYGPEDVAEWWQARGIEMKIGDVVDHTSDHGSITVGFARYAAGAANSWTLAYDEALVVTKGRFTVETGDGAHTAEAGEVIVLDRGSEVVYRAEEESEVVYVTNPHWFQATQASPLAGQLDDYDRAAPPETQSRAMKPA